MNGRISTDLRKWISLITAVIVYYVVHEGSYLLCALAMGAFEEVRFMGLGVQIAINDALLTDTQLAVFCLVGSTAALLLFVKKVYPKYKQAFQA